MSNSKDIHGSERLTTNNSDEIIAKVGTRSMRQIHVHKDDLPLSNGDHFRYLGGFHTQSPTEHGFYPEYGKITKIRESGDSEIYFVNVDGDGSEVEALNH